MACIAFPAYVWDFHTPVDMDAKYVAAGNMPGNGRGGGYFQEAAAPRA